MTRTPRRDHYPRCVSGIDRPGFPTVNLRHAGSRSMNPLCSRKQPRYSLHVCLSSNAEERTVTVPNPTKGSRRPGGALQSAFTKQRSSRYAIKAAPDQSSTANCRDQYLKRIAPQMTLNVSRPSVAREREPSIVSTWVWAKIGVDTSLCAWEDNDPDYSLLKMSLGRAACPSTLSGKLRFSSPLGFWANYGPYSPQL